MSEPELPTEPFSARARPGGVAPARAALGLVTLACAGVALVNLVWLAVGGALAERLIWIVAMSLGAAVMAVAYRRAQGYDRVEVLIDEAGITVVRGKGRRLYPWAELTAVRLVDSGRSLALEGPESVAGSKAAQGLSALNERLTGAGPLATRVATHGLDAEVGEIETAIRHFSGGRFPGGGRQLPPAGDSFDSGGEH